MQEMSFQKPPLSKNSQDQVFERKIGDVSHVAKLVSPAVALNGFAVFLKFCSIRGQQRGRYGHVASHAIFRIEERQVAFHLWLGLIPTSDVNGEYIVTKVPQDIESCLKSVLIEEIGKHHGQSSPF